MIDCALPPSGQLVKPLSFMQRAKMLMKNENGSIIQRQPSPDRTTSGNARMYRRLT
jgi:hypothetical protein